MAVCAAQPWGDGPCSCCLLCAATSSRRGSCSSSLPGATASRTDRMHAKQRQLLLLRQPAVQAAGLWRPSVRVSESSSSVARTRRGRRKLSAEVAPFLPPATDHLHLPHTSSASLSHSPVLTTTPTRHLPARDGAQAKDPLLERRDRADAGRGASLAELPLAFPDVWPRPPRPAACFPSRFRRLTAACLAPPLPSADHARRHGRGLVELGPGRRDVGREL